MDTTWFAVDRDGHVGAFFSDETGVVPRAARDCDLAEVLSLLTGIPEDVFDGMLGDLDEEAARLGIFGGSFKSWDEYSVLSILASYTLEHRPALPLHVDQLPPRFRALAKRIRFDRLRFPDLARVQPLEHVECQFWPNIADVAYLAGDGVTVRPLPGQEGRFAAYCDELRREHPDQAARLRFAGPSGDANARQKTEPGG